MNQRFSPLFCLLITAALGFSAGAANAQEEKEKKPPEDDYRWGDAEHVFTGVLKEVQARGVGLSDPPLYNHALTVEVEKVLRGALRPGETVVLTHSARQKAPPVFPVGEKCLLASRKVRESLAAERVLAADPKTLDLAELACSLPVGWNLEGGKPVSPWSSLGAKAWAAEGAPAAKGMLVCVKTGRPALVCGPGLALEVEHVPPKVEVKFGNPDGDGEYRISLKNTTEKPLTVPALLTQGDRILWEESLCLLCQGKTYPCPGAQGVTGKVEAKTLAPGESVSTVVNALRLSGPEWPRGGYRIEFRFCLGELSQTKSFYYLTRHHDPIRAALGAAK